MLAAGLIDRFIRRQNRVISLDPRLAIMGNKPVEDLQTGFLCHPRGFPLEVRRKWFTRPAMDTGKERIGLIFNSSDYHPSGTLLELIIPVRGRIETFTGTVVLVRRNQDHFEIGLWLDQGDDASRVRIVEQICHIETYLKYKKYHEGPYNLDPERVASEWISKYASTVPALQNSGCKPG